MPSHPSVEIRRVPITTDPMLLTVEETARELRLARRRVYVLITEGALPSVKIGKSRRIKREALAAYVAGLTDQDSKTAEH